MINQYGGSIALFYALVFEVYGARNYKAALSLTLLGFGLSVVIGGLSSAYSFSSSAYTSPSAVRDHAASWYYGMAAEVMMMTLRECDDDDRV